MRRLGVLLISLIGVACAMDDDEEMGNASSLKRKFSEFQTAEVTTETKKPRAEQELDENTFEFKMKVLNTIIELDRSNLISDESKNSLKTSIIIGELNQNPSKIKQEIYFFLLEALQLKMVKDTDNALIFKIATDFGFNEIIKQIQYINTMPDELLQEIIMRDKFIHKAIKDIADIVRNKKNAEAAKDLETLKSTLLVNKKFQQIIKNSFLEVDLSNMTDDEGIDSIINDRVLSAVVNFLPGITELNIGRAIITNKGFRILEKLPNLKSLILWEMELTDEALSNLENLTSLTTLKLGSNNISDKGLIYLLKLKNLTSLSLNNNERLTDAGIVSLKQLSNIKFLDVCNCKNITKEGLSELKKHLPNLKIDWCNDEFF